MKEDRICPASPAPKVSSGNSSSEEPPKEEEDNIKESPNNTSWSVVRNSSNTQEASSKNPSSINEQREETHLHKECKKQLEEKDKIIQELERKNEELMKELESCHDEIDDLMEQVKSLRDKKPADSSKISQSRYWTNEEHERFLEGIKRFGSKDVKSIAALVGTRNSTQVRTHAQKYYLRLERERKKQEEDLMSNEISSPMDSNPDADPLAQPIKHSKTKKKLLAKRRVSMTDMPTYSLSHKELHKIQPSIPQQLIVETTDSVLAQLKGWSVKDYTQFVEGLVHFSDERDINKKCQFIAEKFLPHFGTEDVKQCYIVLQNVVKSRDKADAFASPALSNATNNPFTPTPATSIVETIIPPQLLNQLNQDPTKRFRTNNNTPTADYPYFAYGGVSHSVSSPSNPPNSATNSPLITQQHHHHQQQQQHLMNSPSLNADSSNYQSYSRFPPSRFSSSLPYQTPPSSFPSTTSANGMVPTSLPIMPPQDAGYNSYPGFPTETYIRRASYPMDPFSLVPPGMVKVEDMMPFYPEGMHTPSHSSVPPDDEGLHYSNSSYVK